MIINLKQTEIEQALRAYVVAQGISLHGKDLTISFTAGRRESGITAEVSIEDVEIPGFTNSVEEVVVAAPTKAAVAAGAAAEPQVQMVEAAAEASEELMNKYLEECVLSEAEEPVVETKATVSLFG